MSYWFINFAATPDSCPSEGLYFCMFYGPSRGTIFVFFLPFSAELATELLVLAGDGWVFKA
jgi:hypothetical protein